MKKSTPAVIVWVTAPDLRLARRLARIALGARLVACAQLRPGIESHYWWKTKLVRSTEVLITFKTVAARLKALEALVVAEHPYETPQFVVAQITGGTFQYLTWLAAETHPLPLSGVQAGRKRKETKVRASPDMTAKVRGSSA